MKINLDGQVALVTGGSRGIGRAICVALAEAGATVYVNYSSNSAAADETVALCNSVGNGKASALGFNVGSSEQVDEAVAKIKAEAGGLDILVNNAGITHDGLFVRVSDEDWQNVMNINLNGAFYCSRAAAKIMMKARKGSIVNISSVIGEMGNAGQSSYTASKAALNGLTKSLAKELASRSVTVNAITPGFIETDMTGKLSDAQREDTMKAIPLGRLGKPEDIAGLVVFLAGQPGSYVTGQIFGVNGGMYI
jgi:3-oxoacyl-[acyl-carrier protein] reductase